MKFHFMWLIASFVLEEKFASEAYVFHTLAAMILDLDQTWWSAWDWKRCPT